MYDILYNNVMYLPSTVSLVPKHERANCIRPRRSVWSQPHKLGTLSSHRLWTFMSHAVKIHNFCFG